MRWIGLAIGIAGTIIGGITVHLETGNFFHGVHVGSPVWTTIAISLGCLASILLVWKPKFAAWALLVIAITGVFGNYMMWEGPGTFYLASALIGFTNQRRQANNTVSLESSI